MAEVLPPLSQPAPAVLQHRPSSSDALHGPSPSYSQHPRSSPSRTYQSGKIATMNRNNYNHSGASGYRGTSTAPTYAFKTTPNYNGHHQGYRSASNPAPPLPTFGQAPTESFNAANRQRFPSFGSGPAPPSNNYTYNGPTWSQQLFPRDNSAVASNFEGSNHIVPPPAARSENSPVQPKPFAAANAGAKPSPDRYNRGQKKPEVNSAAAESATQAMAGVTGVSQVNGIARAANQSHFIPYFAKTITQQKPQSESSEEEVNVQPKAAASDNEVAVEDAPAAAPVTTRDATASTIQSVDTAQTDNSKPTGSMGRYRRRGSNMGSSSENVAATTPTQNGGQATPNGAALLPPLPTLQNRSEIRPSTAEASTPPKPFNSTGTVPARSFAEVARRTNAPSPLSRPLTPQKSTPVKEAPASPPSPTPPSRGSGRAPASPAVAAMAALNDREPPKGSKSRFRRAFSFGSSAEMRRAEGDAAPERARLRKEQFRDELDEEQNAIARQQEAAGLGNNIYSGQAGFTGSTDNISISSTASSASLMLRKMGRGVKKGGKSIKGLFRPKSAIGVPPPDDPIASIGAVSMVTVEAEREKVNVNLDPHDQAGGGTGFPRLEKNSLDAQRVSKDGNSRPGVDTRKTIVGGEQDRAEVLASVRRGILKRTGTSSPVSSPGLRDGMMQHANGSVERQSSPAPSNGSNEPRRTGHRRTDSTALEGGDGYFDVPRINSPSSRSLPNTPGGQKRNISFSPRIQFHDVWSSSDYDRRGDIATCNRLTPMLAQQIKEELNTFKMEMEVHELSKPHTHFF